MKSPLTHFVETRHLLRVAEVDEHAKRIEDFNRLVPLQLKPNAAIKKTIVRKVIADGIKYDSLWERAYHIYQSKIMGVPCERNRTEWLPYVDNCKTKKWFPDFKCEGRWVEVKGFWRPLDFIKMEQHPEVKFVDGSEMRDIVKEVTKMFPDWKNQCTVI
jgi:hypothetical protein